MKYILLPILIYAGFMQSSALAQVQANFYACTNSYDLKVEYAIVWDANSTDGTIIEVPELYVKNKNFEIKLRGRPYEDGEIIREWTGMGYRVLSLDKKIEFLADNVFLANAYDLKYIHSWIRINTETFPLTCEVQYRFSF